MKTIKKVWTPYTFKLTDLLDEKSLRVLLSFK